MVAALVQGSWSERWAKFPELQLYADQLNNVPFDIGNWHSKEHEAPSRRTLEEAGAVGNLSRDFVNDDGRAVSMFIVTGRLQDMFYHEPKRCYRAAGFGMHGRARNDAKSRLPMAKRPNSLPAGSLRSEATGRHDQMVYWSWDSYGKWVATDEQKWVFRGQRAAHKIYLIYSPGPNGGRS